jgi:O-antigen/teichoic acid export membrane protein
MKKIFQDRFFRSTAVFFVGSMAAAFLNYLYHPILSRMMSIEDFGEMEALISLSILIGIISGVFSSIAIHTRANSEKHEDSVAILKYLQKVALVIMIVLFLLTLVFAEALQKDMKFVSPYPFVVMMLLLVTGVYFTFRNAWLQGKEDFKSASWAGIIGSASKLIISVALVYAGFRTLGAIGGMLLAQLVALVYILNKTKDFSASGRVLSKQEKGDLLWHHSKYGLLILLSTGCVAFLYTFDVVTIKHYFSPATAGLYSGVATIARIIFFATTAVATVLFPAIKIKNSFQENSKFLFKTVLIVLILGGGAFFAFSLFPDLLITILIGRKYLALSSLMPALSILMLLVSTANVFVLFFMAIKNYALIYLSIIPVIFVLILINFRHGNLMDIVVNFILGAILANILLISLYVKNHIRHRSGL